MKPTAVFFCGDHSPYGRAHLQPIIEHFDLKLVVLATAGRWRTFRNRLAGGAERAEPTSPEIVHRLSGSVRELREWHARSLRVSWLASLGVRCVNVADANTAAVIEMVRMADAEVILSAAYPQIFKAPLLGAAPRGAINFHPSLLPRFRGAHPHYWALATGAGETGVTAHFMTPRIDDGPIICQSGFAITNMNYRELYSRLIQETPAIVANTSRFLQTAGMEPTPQDNNAATYYHGDTHHDRALRWRTMSAKKLNNIIDAGGAHTIYRGKSIMVGRCEIRHDAHGEPSDLSSGTIVNIGNDWVEVLACDRKRLVLRECSRQIGLGLTGRWPVANSPRVGEQLSDP